MEIVHYPHPSLRWKAQPVRRINAELRKTVQQMRELMYEAKGVGLAATQVALPWRLFIINPTGDADETEAEHVLINPEILRKNGSVEGEEGCLSLPDLYGDVPRAEHITVSAYDLNGAEYELTLKDLPSRVVQHEYDHLDGVLFIDRVKDSTKKLMEAELANFEDVFQRKQRDGVYPPDDEIKQQLRALESA